MPSEAIDSVRRQRQNAQRGSLQGPPRRYYTEEEARQAIAAAEKVVSWCEGWGVVPVALAEGVTLYAATGEQTLPIPASKPS